ncbi:MAG: sugar phosphate isomerase/epimerase [Deltaproteobacteria bacterium]|nr:sugar phosphate isomerase/epimerase [Deltaproteobacteria bacterium]
MKYAVCNELFGAIPLREAAVITADHGFHGLELSPFTIFGDFSSGAISQGVKEARRSLAETGLEFAGLHWLLVKPEGLRIATPDSAIRRGSWDHLRRLIDAAAELGGGNLILGSPKQRRSEPGQTREQAMSILRDELAAIAPYAAERHSAILLEALSSDQTDVVNLMEEAEAIVKGIGSPGVGGMLDFHNCTDETMPFEDLVERYFHSICHVHLNDRDGNHPRPGDHTYLPAFLKLRDLGYDRWVSLEIFTTPADPSAVLGETIAYIKEIEKLMEGSS